MHTPTYAVLWDVDGTLVDTARLHFDAWVKLCAEYGRKFTRDDFTSTFGRRNPEIIRELLGEQIGDAEMAEIGERKEGYYRSEAREGIPLLPGVESLLREAHAAGWKQAIGSSAPRGNLDMILKLTGTEGYFGAVVGMEDTRRGKPDPEVFLAAAERLGVPPERCVVLEDAIAGVEAGRAAGMAVVGVTFVGHHPAEKLRAAGAGRVVANLGELKLDELRRLVDQR